MVIVNAYKTPSWAQKHLQKLYVPLWESVLNYGIIHWGSSKHVQPVEVLQNRVRRCILSMGWRTSEKEIHTKIKAINLERLCRNRISMFVLKNKEFFGLYNTEKYARLQGARVAAYLKWRKFHSRLQVRYQRYELFNKPPTQLRMV